jgi:5-(carboxyamino)imidazole ribonucleotide synthase
VTTLVGCIGGGQLGRMLALAAAPLGVRMRFLDPAPDACAGQVGELVVASYDDLDGLARLAESADVVTFEFENVPVAAAQAVDAVPGPRALELGQDRLVEKELFRRLGIETAPFGSLDDVGFPALVKSRRLGYDGKGQRVAEGDETLADDELAEGIVEFDRELSIVAVRGRDGETAFYPLAENEHRGGILAISRVPARGAPQREAEEIASRLLDELAYVGVLAVELFDVDGSLLANEFATRVHNTGHWTIDGAPTSQFENHLRAILGLPLGSTAARGSSTMVNLVGEVPPLGRLLAVPGAHVHLYGKEPRPGRKLGHVTLVDAAEDAVAEVEGLAADAWSI